MGEVCVGWVGERVGGVGWAGGSVGWVEGCVGGWVGWVALPTPYHPQRTRAISWNVGRSRAEDLEGPDRTRTTGGRSTTFQEWMAAELDSQPAWSIVHTLNVYSTLGTRLVRLPNTGS